MALLNVRTTASGGPAPSGRGGTGKPPPKEQWVEVMIGGMVFPVNPDELSITRKTRNFTHDVLELGEISLPNTPDLERISFTSQFWYDRTETPSVSYLDELNEWREEEEPRRLVIVNHNDESTYHGYNKMVLCNDFDTNEGRAGHEDDIYYTLNLVEYREESGSGETGVSDDPVTGGQYMEPPAPKRHDERPPAPQLYEAKPNVTHGVERGDTLWGIAAAHGQPGSAWRELYAIPENRAIIGENPNLIRPGQQLIIPASWGSRTRSVPVARPPAHPVANAGTASGAGYAMVY